MVQVMRADFSFPSPYWDENTEECKDFIRQVRVGVCRAGWARVALVALCLFAMWLSLSSVLQHIVCMSIGSWWRSPKFMIKTWQVLRSTGLQVRRFAGP